MSDGTMKLSVVVQAAVGQARTALQGVRDDERAIGAEAQKTSATSAASADIQTASAEQVQKALRDSTAALSKLRAEYVALQRTNAAQSVPKVAPKAPADDLESIYNKLVPNAKKLSDLDVLEAKLGALKKSGNVDADTFALLTSKVAASRAALGEVENEVAPAVSALSHLSLTSGAAAREYGVLAGELARGNFARLEGSVLTLSNRIGLLQLLFTGVGAAAAGGVAALALLAGAFVKGEQEDEQFNSALIATGNYAGVTLGRLREMAQGFTSATTTIGDAKQVLEALVASGRFTQSQIETIGPAALEMSKLTGKSVEQTVKVFEDLQRSPAKVVKELNDQYHFLDLATYQRIEALENEGAAEQAAELAQGTFAAALKKRMQDQQQILGYAERSWNSIRDAASSAWDAFLGIGRADTVEDKLASLAATLKRQQTVLVEPGYSDFARANASKVAQRVQAEIDALTAQQKAQDDSAAQQSDKALADERAIDSDAASRKLEAARAAAAGREQAFKIAHLQALAEIQRADDNSQRTLLEAKLKAGELSYADYYAQLSKLSKQENDSQIAVLRAQLSQVDEKRSATSSKRTKDPAEQVEVSAKLNELDAQRETILGRIKVLQSESGDLAVDSAAKSATSIDELRKKVDEAVAQLQTLQANLAPEDLPARLDAIANQVRTKYAGLARDVRANADQLKSMGVDIDVVMKLVNAETTKQQVDAQIDSIEKNVAAAQARFQNQQLVSASRVQTGSETQGQARGDVQGAAKVDLAALTDARTKVLGLLNDYPDNPKLAEVLKGINGDIKDLGHLDDSPFKNLVRSWEDTTNLLKNASASWTQGFADQLTNLVTKGKADFKGFAASILSDIAKILIEKELAGIVSLVVPGFAAGGLVQGFAGGGSVSGAGSSTSDSIPALLSNGEYVISAKGVQRAGTQLLDAINGGAVAPAHAARFASGGLVTRSSTSSTVSSSSLSLAINVPVAVTGRAINEDDVQQLQRALSPAMADTARAIIVQEQRSGGALSGLVK